MTAMPFVLAALVLLLVISLVGLYLDFKDPK